MQVVLSVYVQIVLSTSFLSDVMYCMEIFYTKQLFLVIRLNGGLLLNMSHSLSPKTMLLRMSITFHFSINYFVDMGSGLVSWTRPDWEWMETPRQRRTSIKVKIMKYTSFLTGCDSLK